MEEKDNAAAPKRVVPKTKDELIKMLTERLQMAETSITEMQDILQTQREKLQKLTTQLKQKQDKISELIDAQSKTLHDKVQQTLYNTLESANKMRTQAVQKHAQIEKQNDGLSDEITHLDGNLTDGRIELHVRNKKLYQQQAKRNDLKLKEQSLIKREQGLQNDKEKVEKEFERISREHKELYEMVDGMKKLRMYLNATLDTQQRKIDSQKQNRHRSKAPTSNQDNFWNAQS